MHGIGLPRKQFLLLSGDSYNMLKEWPLRDQNSFARTSGVLKVLWTLGDVVRKLRADKGWTQQELGTRADLHQTAVNRLERNSDKSERSTIERAARALNVSVAELFAYADELSLTAELSDAERRAVMAYQRRLIEKRQPNADTVPNPSPPRDQPVRASESPALDRKRRRR